MEQSKSISSIIAKLKIAYPYYFKELNEEELVGMIGIYQELLSGYNELTLNNAVISIISKNKYMKYFENKSICNCSEPSKIS